MKAAKGQLSASNYPFPCEDESVDFIIATSVFTHLGPEQVQHYLSEIFRTLRKGGRCFITYFVALRPLNWPPLQNSPQGVPLSKAVGNVDFRPFTISSLGQTDAAGGDADAGDGQPVHCHQPTEPGIGSVPAAGGAFGWRAFGGAHRS